MPDEGELFSPDRIGKRGHTSDVFRWCRGWDFGGSVEGDWTVGALVGRCKDAGKFVIGDIGDSEAGLTRSRMACLRQRALMGVA